MKNKYLDVRPWLCLCLSFGVGMSSCALKRESIPLIVNKEQPVADWEILVRLSPVYGDFMFGNGDFGTEALPMNYNFASTAIEHILKYPHTTEEQIRQIRFGLLATGMVIEVEYRKVTARN